MAQFSTNPTLNTLFRAEFPLWQREVSEQRAYNVGKMWQKHVQETPLGQTPLALVTEREARSFLLDLPVGYDVRLLLLQWFRRLGKKAVKHGELRVNTFEDVKVRRPPRGARRPKYWDPRSEVPKLLMTADPEQRAAISCAYFGAMRRGDVRLLRSEDVNLDQNTVTFRETKSGRIETIPMVPPLRETLRSRVRKSGLVFPSPVGGAYARNYNWRLDELIERAGVEKRGRSFHAFRHAAAVAAASGVWGEKWSKAEVAKLLRDTTDAVNIYFDILGDALQERALGVQLTSPEGDATGGTASRCSTGVVRLVANEKVVGSNPTTCSNLAKVEVVSSNPISRVNGSVEQPTCSAVLGATHPLIATLLREAPTDALLAELSRRLSSEK